MHSDQLYVQGDLTVTVTECNIDGILFYLTAIGRKEILGKVSVLYFSLGTPHLLLPNIHAFRIFFLAFRSFFVLLFYVFSLCLVLRFSKPLWLSFCFGLPLCYTVIRLNASLQQTLSKAAEVANFVVTIVSKAR